MIRIFSICVGLTALSLAAIHADEPAANKGKGKFAVYQWNCSRSLQVLLTTDNVQEAFAGLEKAKQMGGKSLVASGSHNWFSVIRSQDSAEFQVYTQGCRIGWRKVAEATTAKAAQELAEKQGG